MIVGYIKQEIIPIKFIDKLKYYLGFLKIEQIGQSYVIQIPIRNKELIYLKEKDIYFQSDENEQGKRKAKRIEKKLAKIIKKLINYIDKYQINILVFSNILSSVHNPKVYSFESYCKEILKEKGYIKEENNIYDKNIHTLNGKKVMEYMQYDILEYIFKIQEKNMSQEDIYFMIKKDSKLDLEFLNQFIEKARTVNIVTNDIGRFKNIQENLYEKENILIGVSNNKNKGLRRAKYIFNFNMNQNDLEKFKINRDAILIHIRENVKYYKNSFEGININQIRLNVPDEYIEEFEKTCEECIEEFDLVTMYEARLIQKIHLKEQSHLVSSENSIYQMYYKTASDIIQNDEIKIIGLVGNNGEIQVEEFLREKEKIYEI